MHGFPNNKVVVFQKGPANIEMSCNEMYDGFTGVEFRGEDGGTVENVTFAKNVMYTFSEYALKFDGTTAANVFNNTFVNIASDGLRIEGAGLNTGAIRNNLWANTGSVDSGVFEADHNGYFNAPTSIGGTGDVMGDPLLDTMQALGAGSPMIDAGVDVGLAFSGAAPDIGWHETGLDGCAPAGGGGAGGNSGTGGSGNGGDSAPGASGSGAGGASSGGGGNQSLPEDQGGCSCRITTPTPRHADGSSPGPASWWLAGVAVVALRRRHHPSA
jgi:hypothetical protein